MLSDSEHKSEKIYWYNGLVNTRTDVGGGGGGGGGGGSSNISSSSRSSSNSSSIRIT